MNVSNLRDVEAPKGDRFFERGVIKILRATALEPVFGLSILGHCRNMAGSLFTNKRLILR